MRDKKVNIEPMDMSIDNMVYDEMETKPGVDEGLGYNSTAKRPMKYLGKVADRNKVSSFYGDTIREGSTVFMYISTGRKVI